MVFNPPRRRFQKPDGEDFVLACASRIKRVASEDFDFAATQASLAPEARKFQLPGPCQALTAIGANLLGTPFQDPDLILRAVNDINPEHSALIAVGLYNARN